MVAVALVIAAAAAGGEILIGAGVRVGVGRLGRSTTMQDGGKGVSFSVESQAAQTKKPGTSQALNATQLYKIL